MKSDPFDAALPRPVRTAKAKVAEVVAVCGRCAKRQGLRKREIRERLKAAAKVAAGAATGDARPHMPKTRLRIVETGCLGPCPKRLIAVATGASLAEGRILLIDPSAPASETLGAVMPRRTAAARRRGPAGAAAPP